MSAIIDFFNQQPFTTYLHQYQQPARLATDWFQITDKEKIPELKKLGLEVDGLRVRKTVITNAEWERADKYHFPDVGKMG